MSRIFLVLIGIITAFGMSGCGRQTEVRSPLPQDISAVTQPFLDAVRRGDQRTAERYVAPEFIDKSGNQFAKMSIILKDAPPLPSTIYQRRAEGPLLIFAAKDGGIWVSSEIHMGRINNNNVIRYWDVKKSVNPPAMQAHAQAMKTFVNYGLIALAIFALAGLAVLIWVIRNRTRLLAPEYAADTRRVASTVRNDEV